MSVSVRQWCLANSRNFIFWQPLDVTHVQHKIVRVACGLIFTSPRKISLFDLFCDRSNHSPHSIHICLKHLATALFCCTPQQSPAISLCELLLFFHASPHTMRCHLQAEAGWTAAIPATSPTLRQSLLEIPEHSKNPNTTFNVGTQFHVSDTLRL